MAAHQLTTARASPEPEFVLRGHSHAVTALRFLDEQRLVSGDVGGHCLLWNLATRRPVQNWAAAPLGVLELHAHAGGLLTQTRDGRIRLWDLENLAEPTTTLATNSFFFARCATVGHSEDYAAPPIISTSQPRPPRTKAESGIGAQLASDDDDEEETPPPAKRWCDHEGHARHLVLAPTEPPEATLLWDTRQSQPALKLAPDAGDRTLVRKGDASVLGNAMAMRLWLPQSQPSSKPPLALVGHENGRVLAWDLAMPVPQICAKTPQNAFKSPNVALDVNDDGTLLFAGGVEAKAQAFRVEPGVLKPHGALEVTCAAINELDQHPGVGQLALRGDGKVIASAGWDYRVRLFATKSLRRLAVLRYHDASVNALDWSGDRLATGSKDTKVAVWRLSF
jgi:WD40 repeat protein